jgi:3-oxoacyl-(acyl-carrier-protein) synthase/NADP-dependent 3-hydroxy acid dehydrogenase YdfG/acyl carrier protein
MDTVIREAAIIGVSGIFPEAETLKKFHENLKSGRDSVREIAHDRLKDVRCDPTKKYRPVAFLEEVDKFDYAFFGISKSEAESIDPIQRISLELAYTVFENAGYSPQDYRGSKVGLFLGGDRSFYNFLAGGSDAVSIIGNVAGIIAGRIAYMLDLRGPVIMLDTTCSSSLTAVYEAYNKIVNGDIEWAICGGINVSMFFSESDELSPLNTLSVDGKCKPFDISANGIGSGEGGGMILLKRLDLALRDGDNIQAVIKSATINHDGGMSNGLTAPSPVAQRDLIIEAWEKAGTQPETVTYIEAHGTGTKLGDPIEFQALTEAFKTYTNKAKFCALGAVKSNIGHLDNAAGIAGIIKCLLSLKHKHLYPMVHFKEPNPFLNYNESALFVNSSYKAWNPEGIPRRCGVSAFGLSGTNVHVVLEEAADLLMKEDQQEDITNEVEETLILKISAKSKESLERFNTSIHDFLQERMGENWASILYTLNVGRGDYEYFHVFTSNNKHDFLQKMCDSEKEIFRKNDLSKLTILLSDARLENNFREYLYKRFEVFRETWNLTISSVIESEYSSEISVIADQLSLLKVFNFLKIPVERLIASGLGRISQRLYNEKSRIEDIADLLRTGLHLKEMDNQKFEDVLANLNSSVVINVLFGVSQKCHLLNISSQQSGSKKNSFRFAVFDDYADPTIVLAEFLAGIYKNGIWFSWKNFYAPEKLCRVEVPTYPFQRSRCWFSLESEIEFDQVLLPFNKNKGFKEYLHSTKLVKQLLPEKVRSLSLNQRFVIFGASVEILNLLKTEFGPSVEFVLVEFSEQLDLSSAANLKIKWDDENHYNILKNHVNKIFESVNGLIYFSSSWNSALPLHRRGEELPENELYTSFFIAKAFHNEISKSEIKVVIVSQDASNPDTQKMSGDNAMIGFWKGILSDYPNLDLNVIDFSMPAEISAMVKLLKIEMEKECEIKFSKYINGVRYVEKLMTLDTDATIWVNKGKNKTYLISGGLGRIGKALCQRLAKDGHSMILIGKRQLSKIDGYEDFLNAIQKLGGFIDYFSGDIGSNEDMASIFTLISKKYKVINGVFHLAGIADHWTPLAEKEFLFFDRTLRPKIQGTLLLDKFTRDFDPEYFVNFSSLNAILPKKNSWDYAAANSFQDGMCFHKSMRMNTRYISINWPGWEILTGEKGLSPHLGLSDQVGLDLLEQIIVMVKSNVIVCDPNDIETFKINPFFLTEYTDNPVKRDEKKDVDDDVRLSLKNVSIEEIQKHVMETWASVLKTENIDLNDDFFEIGGHSLNGTQVLNRLNRKFGIELNMDNLFEYGTLSELSEFIKNSYTNSEVSQAEGLQIPLLPEAEEYEVSDTQMNFWVVNHLMDGTTAHNMIIPLLLHGSLSEESLAKSLQSIISHHDSLRTEFRLTDDGLKQHILAKEYCRLKLEVETDLETAHWETYVVGEKKRAFDLTKGPLFRARLINLSERKHLLLLTTHHIIADGWSLMIILNDLYSFYDKFMLGDIPNYIERKVQYRDYAAWIKNKLSSEMSEHKKYWETQLSGPWPRLDLPEALKVKSRKSWNAGTVEYTFGIEQTLQLKEFAQTEGGTLFILLTAIINVLLSKHFHWDDVLIGTVISGRNNASVENVVGNFLNTLPLLNKIELNDSFGEFLNQVKAKILDAYNHQIYPFSRIIEDRLSKNYPREERWLEVEINLHNYWHGNSQYKSGDLEFELPSFSNEYDTETDWYLLFDFAEMQKDVLSVNISFDREVFTKPVIEDMILTLKNITQEILLDPTVTISDLINAHRTVSKVVSN